MERYTRLGLAIAGLLLAIPLSAEAQQQAQVVDQTQMFAGPDTSYPLIATLMPGTYVTVEGCTEGYQWCDTLVAGNRGWVPGSYLDVTMGPGGVYYERPQPIYEYGADIGVPIVAFGLGMYWDRYYHNRPFYRDRDRWYRMPPPPGRMPGPPHDHFDGHRPDIGRPGRPDMRGPGPDMRGPGPDMRSPGRPDMRYQGRPGQGQQPRDMGHYQPQRFDNNHYQPQHGAPGGQPYRPANMPPPNGGGPHGGSGGPHGGNGGRDGGGHNGGRGGDHGGHGDDHKDDKH